VLLTSLGIRMSYALESDGAGMGELRAYFDGLVDSLTTPEGRMGCLMVNSAMELVAADSAAGTCGRPNRHVRRYDPRAQPPY
jgi:hypothetical protein